MSANLQEITVSATNFPNFLALPVKQSIGGLPVNVSIEEIHEDKLEISQHPVEAGAAIADHSFKFPTVVTLTCGWSNSDLAALKTIVGGFVAGSVMSVSDYVSGVYSKLVSLQQSRQPLTVTTGLRQYSSMLIQSLRVTRDRETSNVLMVQATLQEVIIVDTGTATLPPQANQRNPASTAAVQSVGPQNVRPATPAPGGAVPPSKWGVDLISR